MEFYFILNIESKNKTEERIYLNALKPEKKPKQFGWKLKSGVGRKKNPIHHIHSPTSSRRTSHIKPKSPPSHKQTPNPILCLFPPFIVLSIDKKKNAGAYLQRL